MKKIAFTLIITSIAFVSCKEATDKVEATADSTTTEVTEKVETLVDSTTTKIDSATNKVKGAVKVELQKAEDVPSLK